MAKAGESVFNGDTEETLTLKRQQNDRECFSFVNALVALKWTGIEQFILSHVAKSVFFFFLIRLVRGKRLSLTIRRASLPSLKSEPLSTLILLNNLAASGYLSGGLSNVQGGRWRQALISALVGLLKSLTKPDLDLNERRITGQVLKLLPALPSDADKFAPQAVKILESALDRLDSKNLGAIKAEWEEGGVWNDTHLVGSLLHTVDQLIASPKADVSKDAKDLLVSKGWLNKVLEKWYWNRQVMESAVPHVERWASNLGYVVIRHVQSVGRHGETN